MIHKWLVSFRSSSVITCESQLFETQHRRMHFNCSKSQALTDFLGADLTSVYFVEDTTEDALRKDVDNVLTSRKVRVLNKNDKLTNVPCRLFSRPTISLKTKLSTRVEINPNVQVSPKIAVIFKHSAISCLFELSPRARFA